MLKDKEHGDDGNGTGQFQERLSGNEEVGIISTLSVFRLVDVTCFQLT